jgi:hypothetical protein
MTSAISTQNSPPLFIPDLRPLPPYLRRTEPMEVEDMPLQLALLTMEVASQRQTLAKLADLMEAMASAIRPPDALTGLET